MLRLKVNSALCNQCRQCENTCEAIKLIGGIPNVCRQCLPKDALCAKACPNDAFEEVGNGVLRIDKKKCEPGCDLCVKACVFRAIYKGKDGKPVKCDLCYEEPNQFKPKCTIHCEPKALKFGEEQVKSDIEDLESELGWGMKPYASNLVKKMIADEREFRIFVGNDFYPHIYFKRVPKLNTDQMRVVVGVQEAYTESVREELLEVPAFSDGDPEKKRKDVQDKVAKLTKEFLEQEGYDVQDEKAYEDIVEIATSNVAGNLGPLDFLVYNDDFEDIWCNGIGANNPIFVKHKKHGRMATNFYFTRESFARENIINKICDFAGIKGLSEKNVEINTSLPNKDRLVATLKPISDPIAFTIRHFRASPLTLLDLINFGSISPEEGAYLWFAMELGKNVVFVGPTASGKTSLMNALLALTPPESRVVTVEEVREVKVPHRDFLPHQKSQLHEKSLAHIGHITLRESPDKVVLGEVRDKEDMYAFLEVARAGPGCGVYATMHGTQLESCIDRFTGEGFSSVLFPDAVHVMIMVDRWSYLDKETMSEKWSRHVMQIAEITHKIDKNTDRPVLNTIFSFDFKSGKSKRSASKSELVESFSLMKYGAKNKAAQELKDRASILRWLAASNVSSEEYLEALRKFRFLPNEREKMLKKAR